MLVQLPLSHPETAFSNFRHSGAAHVSLKQPLFTCPVSQIVFHALCLKLWSVAECNSLAGSTPATGCHVFTPVCTLLQGVNRFLRVGAKGARLLAAAPAAAYTNPPASLALLLTKAVGSFIQVGREVAAAGVWTSFGSPTCRAG